MFCFVEHKTAAADVHETNLKISSLLDQRLLKDRNNLSQLSYLHNSSVSVVIVLINGWPSTSTPLTDPWHSASKHSLHAMINQHSVQSSNAEGCVRVFNSANLQNKVIQN